MSITLAVIDSAATVVDQGLPTAIWDTVARESNQAKSATFVLLGMLSVVALIVGFMAKRMIGLGLAFVSAAAVNWGVRNVDFLQNMVGEEITASPADIGRQLLETGMLM